MTITLNAAHAPTDRPLLQEGSALSAVVESIGSHDFAERVLSFAAAVVGADHCAAYQLRGGELSLLVCANFEAAPAGPDLSAYEIKRQLSMVAVDAVRIEIAGIPEAGARACGFAAGRRQRILVATRKADAAYCLSIVRPAQHDPAQDMDIELLRRTAGILVSAIAKHNDLVANKPNLTPALSSLPEIEECVLSATDLSRREGEVCARILYGLSSYGIALDLGIGKESVMTYRKRAYLRLGIGSQRELLIWYLALWSATRGEPEAAATLN
jgi:DNA-binding CsgD family transcriptional regulator